ncbi:alpha/beta hydrolase [Geodermatophilus sp. YIM 151500]|uniref:alpha/beta fold hydrolase n=1 Tax=Geodermatophilus sp. YIM 151500 TaxID=2984531 RepID=UPI0021E4A43D|nr:alpha/beta hydrolase [Geodermatophilus sp. YIM 151500]MCV2489659.1 alpha/beta hydrolase [Geodermatophilus sp. YIM 151500]
MTETRQRTVTTHTVGEGDDTIHFDVHGDLSAATPERPALLAFANPMAAAAFAALAAEIRDRPVVTIDPRGAGRNPTGTGPMTPELHAADLHRVVEALGVGAVDAFGSSGGAICLLALLEAHPGDVRRAVVHEPPFVDVLADGDVVLAACTDIRDTYERAGHGPAMAKFIALVMQPEPLPADYLDRPAPDPAAFGMSADDDGDRTNPLMRNMPACNAYVPDYAALAALGERVHVAVGADSGHEVAARGGHGLAERLGRAVDVFPSHHAGFTSAEGGFPGRPEAFAVKLREVLA